MLIAEINGTEAASHPAARVFMEQGFAHTAMGLQVRPDVGTRVAAPVPGGWLMAEQPRRTDEPIDTPKPNEDRDMERDRIRSSNDRDQAAERDGRTTSHNRGYDDAVRGEDVEDIDPDSAQSDIERDDSVTD
jgi:hypothetical protein